MCALLFLGDTHARSAVVMTVLRCSLVYARGWRDYRDMDVAQREMRYEEHVGHPTRSSNIAVACADCSCSGAFTHQCRRRDFLPDFAVSVGGVRNETVGKNGYQVMLGIKVPLYYTTKQREAVRGALASREAAVQELRAVKQELLFRIKDNVAQVQRAEQLITIIREAIIPQARLTLEAAQAGYAVGKVDFLTLLSSLLTLQDNELELHSEIVEHEKALARLEEFIGRTP